MREKLLLFGGICCLVVAFAYGEEDKKDGVSVAEKPALKAKAVAPMKAAKRLPCWSKKAPRSARAVASLASQPLKSGANSRRGSSGTSKRSQASSRGLKSPVMKFSSSPTPTAPRVSPW